MGCRGGLAEGPPAVQQVCAVCGVNSPTAERMRRERQGDSCPTKKNQGFSREKPLSLVPLPGLNLRPNSKPSSVNPWPPGRSAGWARVYLQTGSCGLSETPGASLLRGRGWNVVTPGLDRYARHVKTQDRSLKPGPARWPSPQAFSTQATSQHPCPPLALLSRRPIRDKDTP